MRTLTWDSHTWPTTSVAAHTSTGTGTTYIHWDRASWRLKTQTIFNSVSLARRLALAYVCVWCWCSYENGTMASFLICLTGTPCHPFAKALLDVEPLPPFALCVGTFCPFSIVHINTFSHNLFYYSFSLFSYWFGWLVAGAIGCWY